MDTARATLPIATLHDINNPVLPEIALACAMKRAGMALIETAGAISAYHALGKPLADYDIKEASDAAAAAFLAVTHFHMARKP